MSEDLRVGLLGGTFDPVHVGHVLLAMYLREMIPLDRVLLVPAAVPPHKTQRADMASAQDRWEMVRRAVDPLEGLVASRLELDRPGPSYTADTLAELTAFHPQWRLFLLIGADNLTQIRYWHRPDLIFQRCTVVCGTRIRARDERTDRGAWQDRIRYIATPAFEVSSSAIRDRLRRGLPVRYLVPESVEGYIRQRGLYGAE